MNVFRLLAEAMDFENEALKDSDEQMMRLSSNPYFDHIYDHSFLSEPIHERPLGSHSASKNYILRVDKLSSIQN